MTQKLKMLLSKIVESEKDQRVDVLDKLVLALTNMIFQN